MAEWPISDEVPLRELDGLDHERCAALHNYIVELGWTQRGLALNTLNKRTYTVERLNTSVVSFLKAAWHGFAMDSSKPHLFHRYLGGLSSPEQLWQAMELIEEEDDSDKPCYVLLYMANGALGTTHPMGLVLNQGKILAVDASTYSGEQERTEPWIMPSYTERDLEESLQAFQQLVDAIHDRKPSQPQSVEQGLLEMVTARNPAILPANSFAHRFLAQCPRPAFTHIAPSLSISQNQPFASASGQAAANNLFPLLLFASTPSAHQEFRRAPLYLSESHPHGDHPFEDGCKLVLPFTLGSNAFARTSDGALIGEHVRREGDEAAEIKPKSAELYQLGYNHFIAAHDVQLRYGSWEVDEHSVVGGVEKWKEGDTEEHWIDYQLPMSW
ncbi:hypothetical protein BKA63DRAFT_542329 [Paraphoma chrysanthemicola]|nr:hypothetical protein BKA63DRAFT_542329 [Paraphoma chrysanthemicola]